MPRLGEHHTPEARARIGAAHRGVNKKDAHKDAIAQGVRRQHERMRRDPEAYAAWRASISEGMRKAK